MGKRALLVLTLLCLLRACGTTNGFNQIQDAALAPDSHRAQVRHTNRYSLTEHLLQHARRRLLLVPDQLGQKAKEDTAPDDVPDAAHQVDLKADTLQQLGGKHAADHATDSVFQAAEQVRQQQQEAALSAEQLSPPDTAAARQAAEFVDRSARAAHLKERHDRKYAHHLHRRHSAPPPPLSEAHRKALEMEADTHAADVLAATGGDARTLRRMDAFRKPGSGGLDNATAARPRASTFEVFVMTMLMAACSGLGALPFFFVGNLSEEWAALANAIACGVMLAASFDLVHEGQPYGASLTILGVILGTLFIKASSEWLEKWEDVKFQGLQGINAQKALLLVAVMAAHALGEGSGVGVSFCGSRGWAQGVLVTLAIGLHNIPEGLAVATVLVARGVAPKQALFWTMFTSLPQPLLAVPSFMFVNAFRALLPVALGFAAGCMVWMVFAELLPDALEAASHGKIATTATFSAVWLEALRMGFASLERPDGSLASPFAGDWSVVLPSLAVLLPAALPAAAAGGLVSSLLSPGPALLGTAAGILTWNSGASLIGVVWASNGLGLLGGWGWALVGGAATVVAWRWLRPEPVRAAKLKSEGNGGSHAHMVGVNGVGHTNAEQWIPAAGELIASLSPRAATARHAWDSEAAALQPAQHNGDSLPLYMQAAPPGSPKRQQQWAARRGRGPVPLPDFGPLAASALLAALALVVEGLPMGWQVAAASGDGAADAARLWLPLSLDSLIKGLVGAALTPPLLGCTFRRTLFMAFATGGTPIVTAALQVMRGGDAVQVTAVLSSRVQAAAGGAVLVAVLWLLLPAAQQLRGRSANKGFVVGIVVAAFVHAVTSLLCLATPYCLQASSSD